MSDQKNRTPERPVRVFDDGPVDAAVWRRRDDDGRETYHVTLTKSYTTGDGEHRRCATFSVQDLKKILKCAAAAEDWILAQKQERARGKGHAEDKRARDRPDDGPGAGGAAARSQPGDKVKLDRLLDKLLERLDERQDRGGRAR